MNDLDARITEVVGTSYYFGFLQIRDAYRTVQRMSDIPRYDLPPEITAHVQHLLREAAALLEQVQFVLHPINEMTEQQAAEIYGEE